MLKKLLLLIVLLNVIGLSVSQKAKAEGQIDLRERYVQAKAKMDEAALYDKNGGTEKPLELFTSALSEFKKISIDYPHWERTVFVKLQIENCYQAIERLKRKSEKDKANKIAEISHLDRERELGPEDKSKIDKIEYILGKSDELSVFVWRHSDLNKKVMVQPDGNITFPLVGNIDTTGLTATQLADKLSSRLSLFLKDPKVTVTVINFQSSKYFILGQVSRPGVYPLAAGATVLEAITQAGGYLDTAALKSVIVVRKAYANEPNAVRINFNKVINEANMRENMELQPGDIVFVPKTFIAKLDTFVEQFITKTRPVLGYYLDIIDIEERSPGNRSR
ncbi:MAG: polysaccharide biosynthesis/export family protein [Candidatus Omnitrophica bacterium]|nr:polysaccharide biosynthesis/export family protein [Candidatus Omnitrophota bacterium]